jgi:phenylacetate-CoA ligase
VNPIVERIYRHAPVPLQNALISAYAWQRAHRRYGPEFDAIRLEIARERGLDDAGRSRWLVDRLRRMLAHARQHVTYYRALFRDVGFDPASVDGPEDMAVLPILSKHIVRTRASELRAETVASAWTTETSGSTGTPLTLHLDSYAYRMSMALLAEHEASLGIRLTDRRATLAGRLLQPVTDSRLPLWRHNWADHQLLLSAYHMTDAVLPHYVRALERFDPVELIGYPSAVYALADFCRRAGVRPRLRLRAIVTNSETLFDWQRAVIEPYLGCRVHDYYGTAESVVFAPQCAEGRYHPSPLMGIAEVLDEAGRPARPGESGRLVCTTTCNRAMPLVRYEIGDSVTLADGECACGRAGPSWVDVLGRNDDVVVTPEGRVVGRLDHVFKGVRGVRECQIAHTAPDRLELRVVAEDVDLEGIAAVLTANTRERVGDAMRVEVVRVEAIPRTLRGKFKGVVKEY